MGNSFDQGRSGPARWLIALHACILPVRGIHILQGQRASSRSRRTTDSVGARALRACVRSASHCILCLPSTAVPSWDCNDRSTLGPNLWISPLQKPSWGARTWVWIIERDQGRTSLAHDPRSDGCNTHGDQPINSARYLPLTVIDRSCPHPLCERKKKLFCTLKTVFSPLK